MSCPSKKGIVLSNDKNRKIIVIKWFGCWGNGSPPFWHISIIKYENLKHLDFVKIGISKYETICKPAFIGICGVYGFWYFFGSFITGVLQISALGFGGAVAFIVGRNFKRIIKALQIKKNVTVLNPIQNDDKPKVKFNAGSQVENNDLKLIKNGT